MCNSCSSFFAIKYLLKKGHIEQIRAINLTLISIYEYI